MKTWDAKPSIAWGSRLFEVDRLIAYVVLGNLGTHGQRGERGARPAGLELVWQMRGLTAIARVVSMRFLSTS